MLWVYLGYIPYISEGIVDICAIMGMQYFLLSMGSKSMALLYLTHNTSEGQGITPVSVGIWFVQRYCLRRLSF